VTLLAWAYVTYGATPLAEGLLYGIKPVVLGIVAAAVQGLGRTALSGPMRLAIGAAAALLWIVGVNELVILAAAALTMAAARLGNRAPTLARGWIAVPGAAAGLGTAAAVDLALLGGVFLKAGALVFGSGYVLFAYLRGDLVDRLGWLTDAQLLDAIAIGQVTPGPIFTAATFIGYVVAGLPGAIVATVAIFLPAFLLAAVIARVVARVRDRPLTGSLLDGVNAAAIGLMAAVTLELAGSALVDPLTYAVDLLQLALYAESSSAYLGAGLDLVVLGALAVVLFAWGMRRHPMME